MQREVTVEEELIQDHEVRRMLPERLVELGRRLADVGEARPRHIGEVVVLVVIAKQYSKYNVACLALEA